MYCRRDSVLTGLRVVRHVLLVLLPFREALDLIFSIETIPKMWYYAWRAFRLLAADFVSLHLFPTGIGVSADLVIVLGDDDLEVRQILGLLLLFLSEVVW